MIRSTGNVCAVKQMHRHMLGKDELQSVKEEMLLLARCKHDRLVAFFGASWDRPPFLCMILEFLGGGDLDDKIQFLAETRKKEGTVPKNWSWSSNKLVVAIDMCEGLMCECFFCTFPFL